VTSFDDLGAYQRLPRLSGLALSLDGTRLVVTVAALDPDGTRFRPALWEIDPAGREPARRLTRGPAGESAPAFRPDGGLLFTSARPDPESKEQPDDAPAALWLLPAAGEGRVVGTRPGGLAGPVVARAAGTVVATSMTMPAAVTGGDDETRRTERRERKVTAILHDGHPVRLWDVDLGPDQPRLLAGTVPADGPIAWRDLTPAPGAGGGAPPTTSPRTARPSSRAGRHRSRAAASGPPWWRSTWPPASTARCWPIPVSSSAGPSCPPTAGRSCAAASRCPRRRRRRTSGS
jgi:hypothetical protein